MKFLKDYAVVAVFTFATLSIFNVSAALAAISKNDETIPFLSLGKLPIPFEDLFRPAAYTNIRISPDGKYFAAGKVRDDGMIDGVIIERRTMSVVSTIQMSGSYGITDIRWANKERVLFHFTSSGATYEGTYAWGLAGMNVDGTRKDIIWRGTSDYGGNEAAMLSGRIDDKHYRVLVYPSGEGLKFPYLYAYKLNIYTGKTTRIARSPIRSATPIFDKDKNITHWVGYQPSSFKHFVVASRNASGDWDETVYDESKGIFLPVAWVKGRKDWMWYVDTIEAPTMGLYQVNEKTGEKRLVYRHPKVDYDEILSDDDGNPWGAVINYDYPQVIYLDEENLYAQTHKRLQGTFPNQYIDVIDRTRDNNEWVVHIRDDRRMGSYYLYNQFDGALKFLANQAEWIDPTNVPATHPIRFTARDGMEINGYITLPVNKTAKKLPLIILPHGGPHGPRDYWGYNNERIMFANAGFAVMHINYRGSGGYGRNFLFDWYGHWGLEMQDDLTDATYWAIQSGIADQDRVCIYGASYGGYAALMGVVKEPDLYQCAIGYVGVYDLNTLLETGDIPLRKAGADYVKEAAGATEEKRRAQSSTPHVDRIKAPVFLVHGKRDVRAHWDHYTGMREALLAQQHRLETLVIPRAGHGAREDHSRKEIACRMIDFFNRHIGDGNPEDAPATDCVPEGADGLEYEYFSGVPRA
ncbi:prolyl oligopeptidase family serine peptidase [Microbulbifer bruguierae]|uniref:Prolyl oligopeptidase family serine peptidase n=1 Tax=Microbulbifer bruguierae TaxID=3029061 RepID=A0ABY8NB94_9GAMM|nr:prolyl oligopeptidase family serine peptidase [Microbulbifer bruguierae]WGL16178.1 prolyl oligopeptidase family serine peptidase [Microbulbifer bruguierae]